MKKLCWQKSQWLFDYGWDDSFGTSIFKNDVSMSVSIKGYWLGISW